MRFAVLIGLIMLSACSSAPKIRVKNCKAIGSNLYECEMLPDQERHGKNF